MTENIAVIGMSPGNSYFTDENIKSLIEIVIGKFNKAIVFIPDIPSIATYVALGYPENIARREKSLPKGNNLKNKSLRAIKALNCEDKVRIINWVLDVQNNPAYKQFYNNVTLLYQSNELFHKDCNKATAGVLESAQKKIESLDHAVNVGVTYLLHELAFMEFAPKFLNSNMVVSIYHKPWPVYQSYISGKYDGLVRQNLGFEIVDLGNQ
jgi:cyclo(L-tyrosyl-L-tyrosyl) synthase